VFCLESRVEAFVISLSLLVVQFLLKVGFCVGSVFLVLSFVPSKPCRWRPPALRLGFGCCCSKELGVQMLHVDGVVVICAPLAILIALLLAGAGLSRLILLHNSRIVVVIRIVEACGCLVEGWCVRRSI